MLYWAKLFFCGYEHKVSDHQKLLRAKRQEDARENKVRQRLAQILLFAAR
jgi:heme exporter protein D